MTLIYPSEIPNHRRRRRRSQKAEEAEKAEKAEEEVEEGEEEGGDSVRLSWATGHERQVQLLDYL